MEEPAGIPAGWYTVGASRDLAPGAMRPVRMAGIDLILYRTADGSPCCVQDRCPHMGGRFSAGGSVSGDELVCPVHGFRFAADGVCRGSGYGTPAPRACLERNGLLMVFYHPRGEAPGWEPDALSAKGWLPMHLFSCRVDAPIDVIMQGIADQGHLRTVHGYEDVRMDGDFHTQGERLAVTFSFTNVGALPGFEAMPRALARRLQTRTRVQFRYLACGMGFSVTEVSIPSLGVATRHFVNPAPIDAGSVMLYHSFSLRRVEAPGRIHPLLAPLPRRWVEGLMSRVLRQGYLHDMRDDMRLWTHMRSPLRPALARGDGPLHKYRKWSRQFYSA